MLLNIKKKKKKNKTKTTWKSNEKGRVFEDDRRGMWLSANKGKERDTERERETKSFYFMRTEQNQRKDRGGKRKTRVEWAL